MEDVLRAAALLLSATLLRVHKHQVEAEDVVEVNVYVIRITFKYSV